MYKLNNHINLSGIGYSVTYQSYSSDSATNVYYLIIDGKPFVTYEDPSDGYRSYGVFRPMEGPNDEMNLPDVRITMFEPQTMKVVYKKSDEEELLTLTDIHTGKPVLTVGTDTREWYYPVGIFQWHPENMYVNQNHEIKEQA